MKKKAVYQIKLSVPGFSKEDFKIQVDRSTLTVSVDQKKESTEVTDKILRREFSNKAFKRSFTLDEKIDEDKIDAVYENGILNLNLPKKEEAKARALQISVK